ncbi:39S ribosomal protein L40, mitochondrial-like [Panonychus citri]|uniref:39S ribosomal protein L40, mitochondrial-like n=1 Tax=Panonychus citri TaxID=50023 RepID=UPI0023075E94|nr:39S ribosomal protein L40, mitochondrial-like [Panonychus citri]
MNFFNYCCVTSWRRISTTASLWAEPMKKKRRIDPILLKLRNERKVKRLEKNILKIERGAKQLKPIVELSLPPHVQKEMEIRTRATCDSNAETNFRKLLRLWNVYRTYQSRSEYRCARGLIASQEKALDELKKVSPHLWAQAIGFDQNLIPYIENQTVKTTPANPNYTPPDGHIKETTKEWKL